jgi:membrane-bound serine protease (ClpP class)
VKRLALGLAACALAIAPLHAAIAQEEVVVEVVDLEGVIDPQAADFLTSRIERANDQGAEAIVIQLDTPGGLVVSTEDMVKTIEGSSVPVIVWVGPPGARAASAGVFLVYASHVASMAEATRLGAAHPVDLGGDLTGEQERKAVNDAVALLRSLAQQRDRNEEFAEAAVRESATLTSEEAADQNVVEVLANSVPELLREVDGTTVETATGSRTLDTEGPGLTVRVEEPGLLSRILHAVTNPTVAYVLLVLGFWALVFEIAQPGIGFAGFAGAVALVLAFYAFSVLPLNVAGLALLLLGLVLFTIDVFTAGLGVFTAGGTIALAFGSVLLFSGVSEEIAVPIWVIVLLVGGSFLFFGFAMTVAMRARKRPSITGHEGLVGLLGESRADLSPEGQVWVKGAMWRARALNGPIGKGRPVRVRRVDGLLLIVQEERGKEGE